MAATCPNRGPGRLEGNPFPCMTAAYDAAAGEGFADEETGDATEGPGWAALFRSPIDPAKGGDFCPACCTEAVSQLATGAGAILTVDSQGFLWLHAYPKARDATPAGSLEAAWSEVQAALEPTEPEPGAMEA